MREITACCGITERSAHRIIEDLEQTGYLVSTRVGRMNRYQVISGKTLRHPADSGLTVADILALFIR